VKRIDRSGFAQLLEALDADGYDLVGPTVRDGAIVLDRIEGVEDLPAGVAEQQRPGGYELSNRGDERLFDWAHGPESAKRFLFPPREVLAKVRRTGAGLVTEPGSDGDERPVAFVGLRSCDLHAIQVLDRVFLDLDPAYRRRRESAVYIGVNCSVPGSTCFCASMGTGPRCTIGFDLALTELEDGFVVEVASPRGEEILERVPGRDAVGEEVARVERTAREAEARMGRHLDAQAVPALLSRNREHPRWAEVAERCLACANCTSVCPTCFCHDVTDQVSLSGDEATRTREWASCFGEEFSHIVGLEVRKGRASRYRQWLTHKFSAWVDQFGTSGCVGCGRCITWCPVGIDVVEEIEAIRRDDVLEEAPA
jgi:ferredoxin